MTKTAAAAAAASFEVSDVSGSIESWGIAITDTPEAALFWIGQSLQPSRPSRWLRWHSLQPPIRAEIHQARFLKRFSCTNLWTKTQFEISATNVRMP